MQLLVLVLNKTECLEPLMEALLSHHLCGATVLDSTGMLRILDPYQEQLPIFGSLRHLFDPERESSKTIFMVLPDAQVEVAMRVIREVTGGLDKPDTGIAFALPTLFVEGLKGEAQK
ncbi:MAG: hypothetical protein RR482_00490 [Clostridia bacterium]